MKARPLLLLGRVGYKEHRLRGSLGYRKFKVSLGNLMKLPPTSK